ncbi:MAG: HAD family hydrolase [Opitutaceae bacterium]|nr:HAD family hydrolase [Opitutaceae bacterium]|tara:strand:+ start:2495 stop:3037 length:543 start_codon:yes stop_codon:yes gene_type:complete
MTSASSKFKSVSMEDWQKIKLLALDVDGVLTDGTIFMGADRMELKRFSVLDGLGLVCLKKLGIELAIISGRLSPATKSRAEELQFDHVVQSRKDKGSVLKELSADLGFSADQVCYVGDDVIDIPAIEFAGMGIAVPNAMPATKKAADWITGNPGGKGAVREVCDRILESRNESVLSLSTT